MSSKPKRARGASSKKAQPKANGRPSKYLPHYARQAHCLALLGLIDEELAKVFDVSVATLNSWKKSQPGFLGALKDGRTTTDAKVAERLYERAMGYEHESVKIFLDEGEPVLVPFIEHYPPDTVACIFWLKNRQPKLWRDIAQLEHKGEVAGLPADVLAIMRKLAVERAKESHAKPKPDKK